MNVIDNFLNTTPKINGTHSVVSLDGQLPTNLNLVRPIITDILCHTQIKLSMLVGSSILLSLYDERHPVFQCWLRRTRDRIGLSSWSWNNGTDSRSLEPRHCWGINRHYFLELMRSQFNHFLPSPH